MLEEIKSFLSANSRTFPALGGIAGVSLALGKGLYPLAETYWGESGLAVIIEKLRVEQLVPGESGAFTLHVSKIRNCRPTSSAMTLVDAAGKSFAIENSWSRVSLPMGMAQIVEMEMTVPKRVAVGVAQITLTIEHGDCVNGGSQPPPQRVTSNLVLIDK